ncbi:pirin-like C-terminal cupin domain-containing protein [Nonomuraea sp. NPDC050153]|uniref:pirin-like C-terminal cupin domain-containing protein n=1 Tax=Nonomuraea sp. NPDC050153 TaxID=3364359 RepID=UPI0037AC5774
MKWRRWRGSLAYLPPGRERLWLSGRGQGLLIGGEPFGEEIVMWWNFVGRSHNEIVAFRKVWMEGEGFGHVEGFAGGPLPAPSPASGSNPVAAPADVPKSRPSADRRTPPL